MKLMRGLTPSTLKQNKSLIPLFSFVVLGFGGAMGYLTRLITTGIDVCWDKKNKPHPNLTHPPTYQYKFYSPLRDYSKEAFPIERPMI